MKSDRPPVVAILIDTSLQGGRSFVLEVANWARTHGPWRLIMREGRVGEQNIDLSQETLDGIIASCDYVRLVRPFVRRGVPIVVCEPVPLDLRQLGPLRQCPVILHDSHAVGVLAANYYLERRYRSFAYVGDTIGTRWSRKRQEGFADTLAQAKFTCAIYPDVSEAERLDWTIERPRMIAWLRGLKKPVGVFAAMDGRARLVLDACATAGIGVPEEVSVLGVDNDVTLCESAYPTLSSIRLGGTGTLAAQTLSDLLDGKPVEHSTVDTGPIAVVTRESTGHDAMRIPVLAHALKFIFHCAPKRNISAADVIRELNCSRRIVETAFRTHIGCSILDEIHRVRFEHVKHLLETTSLSIREIAEQCDFPTQSQLAFRFRQLYGVTLSEWRKTHAAGATRPGDRPHLRGVSFNSPRT